MKQLKYLAVVRDAAQLELEQLFLAMAEELPKVRDHVVDQIVQVAIKAKRW